MIVEFSVKNFRSIKELQTISFATSGLKSSEKFSNVDKNNIIETTNMSIFKTVGIYGANGSGKSNIIKAFEYFIKTIKREPSSESNMSLLCDPFLYQSDKENTESFFQIVLLIDNKKYRYGFTVKKNNKERKGLEDKYSSEIITNEWLIGTKVKNLGEFFTRTNNKISNEKLPNKELIPSLPYDHSLYLSHVAAFDKKGACQKIRYYLSGFVVSNLNNDCKDFRTLSIFCLKDLEKKRNFLKLLSSFNLKYDDIILDEDSESTKQKLFPQNKINFSKKYIGSDSKTYNVNLNLRNNESAGTQKLFDLAGLLLVIFSFDKPAFIIIDEIDSNFHPFLLKKLIELFNNPSINKSKSQLLFTSHDTNLMSPSIMRRDQFYFTEKNEDNSSRLYSLADLKGIRNDADFAKQYLAGFYGALPILSEYSNEINIENE